MTRLAMIRHGPTAWNEEHRLQGRTDVPLSETGTAKVGSWVVPDEFLGFDWVASPLVRAAETARLLGLEFNTETAIIEMDWGAWEGHTRDERDRIYGDGEVRRRADRGLDLRPHDGESPRELRVRVSGWLERVVEAGRPTGAVTHQGVIRALLSLATGWDMLGKPPVKLDWSSLHLFDVADGGRVEISRVNINLEAAGKPEGAP
jgi:probable phosphoglycerate mutase